MENIIVESPSKINIGLNVISKRNDGFHNIETIFFPLLLSDRISFSKNDSVLFISDSELLNNIPDNLILRSIKILEEASGRLLGVRIKLEKCIPIGGGLGGGSSNAATTLKALNKLFDLGMSYQNLFDCALRLGSDVPYFLNPVPAYAESRGEKLYPIRFELPYPILIVNPGINVKTSWAFSMVNPEKPLKDLRTLLGEGLIDFDKMNALIKNDFETIVFQHYPIIKKLKNELIELGANFAMMTGTGASIYGIFSNLQKAYNAVEYYKQEKYFTYLNIPFKQGAIT